MIFFKTIWYLVVFLFFTSGILLALFAASFLLLDWMGVGVDTKEDDTEDDWDSSSYSGLPSLKINLEPPKYFLPLLLVCASISAPLAYYSLSLFDYYPPFVLMSRASLEENILLQARQEVGDLTDEAQRIHSALTNIKNLTLNDIEDVLRDTLTYLAKLKDEAMKKELALATLKNQHEVMESQLKELKSLSREQLNAVASAVSRDSTKFFWMGMFISFPTGVVASFIATWIWNKLHKPKKTDSIKQ